MSSAGPVRAVANGGFQQVGGSAHAQSLVNGATITRAQATQEPRLAQQFVAAAELTGQFRSRFEGARDNAGLRQVYGDLERQAIDKQVRPDVLAAAMRLGYSQELIQRIVGALTEGQGRPGQSL